jgi:hypothetical protein
MLFRASVLSLLILVTVAASLPFGESLAAYGRRAAASRSGKKNYRRRSRAWRARRRAYLRRQRALAAARRRRQRAWVLRRRRAATRRATVARVRARRPQTLRALLAPMRLPTASPSAVESIQSIEMEIAAPPQLAAPQVATVQTFIPQFAAPQVAAATQVAATQPAAPQLPTRETPLAQLTTAGALAHAAAPRLNHSLPAVAVPPAAAPLTLASPALVAPLAAATPFTSRAALAAAPVAPAPTAIARPAQRITGLPVPRSWQAVSSTLGGEFKFSVRTAEGRSAGAAVWSRVAVPAAAGQDRRNKTLGGVSHAALRRTVIDRMIVEGGWVVNDFEREVNGRRVFVVFAQSEGERGARRNWMYYFTETDGLVYSLATTTTTEFADSVAADAEQTLSAILSRTAANEPKH